MTTASILGSATGIGSMPGTSPAEAARIVVGELPDLIHVVELPARGPGADMIGRTGGLLVGVSNDFGLETTPGGWRFAGTAGRQMRRAQAWLREDLDVLQESADGYRGPIKSQVAGPWTLAASIELPGGERALRDVGACEDIGQGIAEVITAQVHDLRRRFPDTSAIVLQLDEPGLPAVLEGRVGTASGLSSYGVVDEQVAQRILRLAIDAAHAGGALVGIHCCAARPPLDLMRDSGVDFVSIDATSLTTDQSLDEGLGAALEAGVGTWLGAVPSTGEGSLSDSMAALPVTALLRRLGINDERALAGLVVTPSCGLAGASPQWARTALSACREAGRGVRDLEREEE